VGGRVLRPHVEDPAAAAAFRLLLIYIGDYQRNARVAHDEVSLRGRSAFNAETLRSQRKRREDIL
jgi:hypothetical protein